MPPNAFSATNRLVGWTDHGKWFQQSFTYTLMITLGVIQLSNTKHI